MKYIFRIFLIETIAVYVTNSVANGMIFEDKLTGILITGAALAAASLTIKPIINILILPLSIATLGLLRFISHAITLYIVDLALPQFQITHFSYPGLSSQYLDLPSVSFPQGPMAYIAFSLLISIIVSIGHWISK